MAISQRSVIAVPPPPSAAVAAAVQTLVTADAVAVPSARWRFLEAKRELPRTLMGGTEAMRLAGRFYLYQHPAESDESYQLRLMGTTLYNGFAETVVSQSGKFFANPVVLKDNVPTELQTLAQNIDGLGTALDPFCVNVVLEGFVDGIAYVLVDYPKVEPGTTLADVQATGARPYWCLVRASDLIGLRTATANGQMFVTQARIRETTTEDDGEFGERTVQRIRVLEPGRWRIYERRRAVGNDASLVWVLTDMGATSLNYVPLVPFYVNRTGFMEGQPPLRTLAELNLEHWISSSEQRRALSFLRFAMLAITGVAKDQAEGIEIGADKVLALPPGASAAYVEHGGSGIGAGATDLEAIEKRMASAGMELRVENAGQVTATAAAIDTAETTAGLMAVAKSLEDGIEQCLQITAELLGLSDGGEVEVNDEFGNIQLPGQPADLLALRSANAITRETLWSELKRRHVLDEDFDPEVEAQRLDDEQAKTMQMQQDQAAATAEMNAQHQSNAAQEQADLEARAAEQNARLQARVARAKPKGR